MAVGLTPTAFGEGGKGWDWGEILNKFQLFWSSFLYFNNKKPFGSAVWYPGLDLGTEQGQ